MQLITFFRKGTPNKGLELLFNIPPLEVFLVKTAINSFFRTAGLEPFSRDEMKTTTPAHIGHRGFISSIVEECTLVYIDHPVDSIPPLRMWDRFYKVDMYSMDPKNVEAGIPVLNAPGIVVYTDGSKEPKGHPRTGAGVVFYEGGIPIEIAGQKLIHSYKLMGGNSVFQTEVWAIKKATMILLENIENDPPLGECWIRAGREVTFYTDSQSTLKALNAVVVSSKLVKETIDLLNKLAMKLKALTIRWVKGHDGHSGNVRADEAALKGRDELLQFDIDSPNLPLATQKMDVNQASVDMWKAVWKLEKGKTCRQTFNWFPDGPRPDFSFDIIRLPKVICSQVIQFITGHTFLKQHQAVIDGAERDRIVAVIDNTTPDGEDIIPLPDPTCRRCGVGKEDPEHVMSICPNLATTRLEIFGHPFPEPPYVDVKVYQLVAFLKEIQLPSLEMRPFLEEYNPTSIPEEARPTPPPPIVEGAEPISEDDDLDTAATKAAEAAGGRLLHNYLVTSNKPPLHSGEGFY